MGTSYSAIKIPVPGNLIDTPGAQNGHLLHFNDGVYTNFVPLIVDLRPDTGNQNLTFNVSVGSGDDSYNDLTETGMYLQRANTDSNDMRLSINNGTQMGNANLHVEGNTQITEGLVLGPAGKNLYFDNTGYTRPTTSTNSKFLRYQSNGEIKLDTLENSTTGADGAVTLKFKDNQFVLELIGEDGIHVDADNTISAHVAWLRNPNNGVHTKGTGIAIDMYGVFSINVDELSDEGVLFSEGDGITIDDAFSPAVLEIDTAWCGDNLFVASTGIDINLSGQKGHISIDFAEASDGLAGEGLTGNAAGRLCTPWKYDTHYHYGGGTQHDEFVAMATEDEMIPVHLRIQGSARYNVTGAIDTVVSQPDADYWKHFSAVFSPPVPEPEFPGQTDMGGINILTSDTNNDELAIKCENLAAANDIAGHNDTHIPLTASHHPLFYVKATSGIMYNSSNYYTEGRIVVGREDSLIACGFSNARHNRQGHGSQPNPPCHINIISSTPTMMMHQTEDAGAPVIVMTSMNENNVHAWGPVTGGSHHDWDGLNGVTAAAATYISNRDSTILSIETSTNFMTGPAWTPDSTAKAEARFNSYHRAAVWSLDYHDSSGTDGDGDPNTVDYYYMRMGAADYDSTSPGNTYLPTGCGSPPEGMKVGGFWLDVEVDSVNPTVKVYADCDACTESP